MENPDPEIIDGYEQLKELAHLLAVDCMSIDGDQLDFVIDLCTDESLGLQLPEALGVLRKVKYAFVPETEE